MGIENIMFLALGFLAAGLFAIAVIPAIVRRAVRLTRRRIEAATPMTLNEFRADKDKLRAEFAIATRRAELQRERLRDTIAEKAVSLEKAISEIAALRTERDEQFDAIRDLQNHLEELRQRIADLTRDNQDLATRLHAAEDAYPARSLGAALPEGIDPEATFDPETLSGHYEQDVEDLLMALGLERQRADLYRAQVQDLVARTEGLAAQSSGLGEGSDTSAGENPESEGTSAPRRAANDLDLAQARIEEAENRLSALVEPSHANDADSAMLAEELSLAEGLGALRQQIDGVKERVLSDYRTRRFAPEKLRKELEAIASDVSALVYAGDAEDAAGADQSLFDRIRKYAGDTLDPAPSGTGPARGTAVADRMAALRELRGG